ncbi:MAG: hypothetical protein WCP29_02750 [Acidobacteriota bacterium]
MSTLLDPLPFAGLTLRNRIVREGHADVVGVGRAMLEDPAWARKAIAGLSNPRPNV